MENNLIYFVLLALLAEVLGTIGGFGSSMLFVPIAGIFLDFHSVLGITALFHVSSNISKIALFRKGFDKKLILRIGVPAIIFVIVGATLSNHIDSKLLEIILALFLITISLLLICFKFLLKPTLLNSLGGGGLSGLTAGLLGTGGAIRGLTLAAFNLPKEIFVATSAIIDLGIDLSRSVVYFSNGFVHKHDFYLVAILFVVSFAGTFIGRRMLGLLSQQQFRTITLILILLVGIFTLSKLLLTTA